LKSDATLNLTHDGTTMPLAEWAAEVGIKYSTLWSRVYQLKWSPGEALGREVRQQRKYSRSKRKRVGVDIEAVIRKHLNTAFLAIMGEINSSPKHGKESHE